MNLQEIAKRKNLYNDLSYYFKMLSSILVLIGAFDHKEKITFFFMAGVSMGCSLISYLYYVYYRKLEGA